MQCEYIDVLILDAEQKSPSTFLFSYIHTLRTGTKKYAGFHETLLKCLTLDEFGLSYNPERRDLNRNLEVAETPLLQKVQPILNSSLTHLGFSHSGMQLQSHNTQSRPRSTYILILMCNQGKVVTFSFDEILGKIQFILLNFRISIKTQNFSKWTNLDPSLGFQFRTINT